MDWHVYVYKVEERNILIKIICSNFIMSKWTSMQLLRRLKQSIPPYTLSMSRLFWSPIYLWFSQISLNYIIKRPDKLENIFVYYKPVSDKWNTENINAIIYEIRHYSKCWYISATKASCRIFAFPIPPIQISNDSLLL